MRERPLVLVLDEPTAALDAETTRAVSTLARPRRARDGQRITTSFAGFSHRRMRNLRGSRARGFVDSARTGASSKRGQ